MTSYGMESSLLKEIGKGKYLNEDKKSICNRSETIGNILKFLRNKIGLTQQEIADRIGIAQQTYAGYESGKHEPSIEITIRLATVYDVTMDYITGRFIGDGSDRAETEAADMEEFLQESIAHNTMQLHSERSFMEMVIKSAKKKPN